MIEYYNLIAEFCTYPKVHGDDVTMDFFCFLEQKHPTIWENLQKFYSDDWEYVDEEEYRLMSKRENPRPQHRYGWDGIASPGRFPEFLNGFKSIFHILTEANYGTCFYCQKEAELATEHPVIVSWDFAPMVKYYEAYEMDGSVNIEKLCCRDCAVGMYKKLVDKSNPERVECWG